MSTELRIANTAGGVAQATPTAQSAITTEFGQPAPRVDLDPYSTTPTPFTPMAVTACCGPGLFVFMSFTSPTGPIAVGDWSVLARITETVPWLCMTSC